MMPLVTFETAIGANRLAAVCERAEAQGFAPGMGLAEARARYQAPGNGPGSGFGLDAVAADRAADFKLLAALADWCDRYTPLVAFDALPEGAASGSVPLHGGAPLFGCEGLVLDISGCAHLFGGEKALMDDLLTRLFHQGFAAEAAIAAHPGTASTLVAVSRGSSQKPELIQEGGEIAAIEALPVAALRLDPATVALLRRLGLKTVASLLGLPRAGLARRFGEGLLRRLDEASAHVFRPISPRRAVADLTVERRLFEPISLCEDIERMLLLLAERLEGDLEVRGLGARRLELSLFRVDGAVERLAVGTTLPVRDPARIVRLFRERLKAIGDERDAGFGYDLVRLAVFSCETMEAGQTDLSGERLEADAFAVLIDRIGARLGSTSVLVPEAADSHRPERAESWRRPIDDTGAKIGIMTKPQRPMASRKAGAGSGFHRGPPALLKVKPRPLRLFSRPEPIEASFEVPDGAPLTFRWRRALHLVRKAEGPERIGAEWWREPQETPRDYYNVEDDDGRRFWLFREGRADNDCDPEGLTADGRPAWYMHGVFA